MNVFSVNCPSDCSAHLLPAIVADQECTSYDLADSQVSGIYFVPPDRDKPVDWTQPGDWEAVLNNSTPGESKYLVGIGGVAEAEKEVVELFKGKNKVARRTYEVTLTVQNLSDAQYEFLRALQCGDTSFTFWFENMGGHLFGGPSGIKPSYADCDLPLSSDRTAYEDATVILRFDARTDPDRTAWDGITDANSGGSGGIVFAPVPGDDSTVFGPAPGDDSTVFGPTEGATITYSTP